MLICKAQENKIVTKQVATILVRDACRVWKDLGPMYQQPAYPYLRMLWICPCQCYTIARRHDDATWILIWFCLLSYPGSEHCCGSCMERDLEAPNN